MRVTAYRSLFICCVVCDLAGMTNCQTSSSDDRRERASVTLLFAGVLTVLGVLALGVIRVANAADERARAQSAADAAALVGASEGEPAARQIASANHGELTQFVETALPGPDPQGRDLVDVFVEVHLGEAVAMATARRAVVPWNSEVANDGDGEFWNPTTTVMATTTTTSEDAPFDTQTPPGVGGSTAVPPGVNLTTTTIRRASTTTAPTSNRTTIVVVPTITSTTTSSTRRPLPTAPSTTRR
jgi:Putative Flp pilus-assembly TadE/G-like